MDVITHKLAEREAELMQANRPVSVFLTAGYLDFAHFKLRSTLRQQGEPDLSARVK